MAAITLVAAVTGALNGPVTDCPNGKCAVPNIGSDFASSPSLIPTVTESSAQAGERVPSVSDPAPELSIDHGEIIHDNQIVNSPLSDYDKQFFGTQGTSGMSGGGMSSSFNSPAPAGNWSSTPSSNWRASAPSGLFGSAVGNGSGGGGYSSPMSSSAVGNGSGGGGYSSIGPARMRGNRMRGRGGFLSRLFGCFRR